MNLRELIEAVNHEVLTKTQLEGYERELTHLKSLCGLEKSDLEKKEALYYLNHQEKSDVAARRKWDGSPDGQRLIELDNVAVVITANIKSVVSRLYNNHY